MPVQSKLRLCVPRVPKQHTLIVRPADQPLSVMTYYCASHKVYVTFEIHSAYASALATLLQESQFVRSANTVSDGPAKAANKSSESGSQ